VFTRIINGELPAHIVHRDDHCIALLSIAPIATGHTLVVPLAEIDHWLELDADLMGHLTVVAQRIGRAQMVAFSPERVGMMIAGLEVPHVHLHVLPINDLGDLDFANADASVDPEHLAQAAEALRAALAELP
jgi:histidine triad (HIT) family protein